MGRISREVPLRPVQKYKNKTNDVIRFVDVIHTAGKWVGNEEVIGHADFYPNHGRAPQPGCEERESLDLTCSHFKVNITLS